MNRTRSSDFAGTGGPEPKGPPVYVSTEGMPRFRGFITSTFGGRGFGFINIGSIVQLDGPKLRLPKLDLLVHVNENRDLGDPLKPGLWITFFVRDGERNKSGLEVFGAEYESEQRSV